MEMVSLNNIENKFYNLNSDMIVVVNELLIG